MFVKKLNLSVPLRRRVFLSSWCCGSDEGTCCAPKSPENVCVAVARAAGVFERDAFGRADQGDALSIIDHWVVGAEKTALQTKLNTGNGAFDGALLTYMTTRAGTDFFWNTSDVASIKTFVNANISTSSTVSNADSIVSHEFPDGDSGVYNVNLGSGDINWKTVGPNTEFVHTLNRMAFWQDLAQAYIFTGNASYVNELVSELASWSQQSPPLADPNSWASSDPPWEPLDVAMHGLTTGSGRIQMVLGSSGWTGDAKFAVRL